MNAHERRFRRNIGHQRFTSTARSHDRGANSLLQTCYNSIFVLDAPTYVRTPNSMSPIANHWTNLSAYSNHTIHILKGGQSDLPVRYSNSSTRLLGQLQTQSDSGSGVGGGQVSILGGAYQI